MFGFLKKKLKDVVGKFSKEVEKEAEVVEEPAQEEIPQEVEKEPVQEDEPTQEIIEEPQEKTQEIVEEKEEDVKIEKPISKKDSDLKQEKEKPKQEISEPAKEEPKQEVQETTQIEKEQPKQEVREEVSQESLEEKEEVSEPKRRGFFSKISDTFTKFKLSEEKFDELFWDLEVALLENNVAMEVIEKIKDDLKEELTKEKISRKKSNEIILESLQKSLKDILSMEKFDLLKNINSKKPYVIAVIGVNGSGKTTTIAKLCNYLKNQNKTVVLAAADTFRAAAIQQIEHHANNLDIKLIKHDYNSDPSAVAFDAIRHAESKGLDVVVIDTAGRLHSNDNLMNELKKLVRVNKPDLKLFVGESITGNDCVEQAKKYDEIIGIDAIILSKADIDEKGGAALSISYVTKKPVIFLGTGQNYEDLEPFDKQKILDNLGV